MHYILNWQDRFSVMTSAHTETLRYGTVRYEYGQSMDARRPGLCVPYEWMDTLRVRVRNEECGDGIFSCFYCFFVRF